MTGPWAEALPWAIVLPLVGAALTPAVAVRHPRVSGFWAWGVLLVTAVLTAGLVSELVARGPFSYGLGGWAASYGIELRFDHFSAWVLPLVVLFVVIVPFSWRYLDHVMPDERRPPFYALLLLNAGGMIGFCVTGDLFNLFVFTEVVSLSSYALVAVGGRGLAAFAALKYLFIGAVSSLLMLFATAQLFVLSGSLNMADVSLRLGEIGGGTAVMVAFAAYAVSFMVKAAMFPVHVWLPDAHAIAPSPVSAVLSGMVVKVGIVGMLRIYQIYFGAEVLELGAFNLALVWLGAISIVMGAFFAIFQDDIKLMLAYSTISNIGYIVLGLGLASPYAVIGAAVHVFNHALIKATLFLAAGSIIHQTGFRTLSDLRGVARTMPQTSAAMAIGAVSIVGLPPTAGFVCKWYIALGAFEANQAPFGFALVFGALFIFIYYIRMLNAFYFQPPVHASVAQASETPWSMRGPVVLLASLCLILGVLGGIPLTFVEPAVLDLLPFWGQ
ncbi:MAG: proton-conducting transporter membrane subunit [Trueperaceae bacterium]